MGSSSIILALESIGIRTYGPSELLSYSSYYKSQGDLPAYLVGVLRHCGVRAFNADDKYTLLPDLLALSPGAKILHLQRQWSSWALTARATENDILLTILYHGIMRLLFCNWLPYSLVWPSDGVGSSQMSPSLTAVLFSHCFRQMDDLVSSLGTPMQFHMSTDPGLFEETRMNVTKLVPSSRILDFDIKSHGWQELSAFLGLAQTIPGRALPNAKQAGQYRVAMLWWLFPMQHIAFVLLMTLCLAINWMLFYMLKQSWERAWAVKGKRS